MNNDKITHSKNVTKPLPPKSINADAQMMNNIQQQKNCLNIFSVIDFDLFAMVGKMYIKIQIDLSQMCVCARSSTWFQWNVNSKFSNGHDTVWHASLQTINLVSLCQHSQIFTQQICMFFFLSAKPFVNVETDSHAARCDENIQLHWNSIWPVFLKEHCNAKGNGKYSAFSRWFSDLMILTPFMYPVFFLSLVC